MHGMAATIHYININGEVCVTDRNTFSASPKITEADSLFESMRFHNGRIVLEDYHADRLRKGLEELGYPGNGPFDWHELRKEIDKVVKANQFFESARIRLVIRPNAPQFVVESWALGKYSFHEKGLEVDVYHSGSKEITKISNLKKGSELSYLSAINFAKGLKMDEVIILNKEGRVCESAVSNIFWLSKGVLHTIPLQEGPVEGVLRRYIMEKTDVKEKACTMEELLEADEIFLTNMIRGIQPVTRFRTSGYATSQARSIFEKFIEPLTR